jgi:dihydrofolate reductase
MEHDLVDELRLTVFPVAVGAGERLFGETSDKPRFAVHGRLTGGRSLDVRRADEFICYLRPSLP